MDSATPSANPKADLADKLKSANNILVTVSRNPSVDQLAACLGLTLLLNKLNKHAAAVFSGEVPSTLEFLQPEETLEKNTDSLRDFIIALDKSKADKLRYKVEDQVVRIFITPYKTSISQDDLEFSQGDFNVDVVVGLGVQSQDDLDEAITAHGRILHDATVATINTSADGGLGSINWHDTTASSLSELVSELAQNMGKDLLDQQIATALLTGIVAETARFSNEKTSSQTMSISAVLMAAGANQQLVATKLDEPPEASASSATSGPDNSPAGDDDQSTPSDGALDIDHEAETEPVDDTALSNGLPAAELPEVPSELEPGAYNDQTLLPDSPQAELKDTSLSAESGDHLSAGSTLMTEPPTIGGTLTANSEPEGLDPMTDPLSLPSLEQNHLLDHQAPAAEDTALPVLAPTEPVTDAPAMLPAPEPEAPNPESSVTPIASPPEPAIDSVSSTPAPAPAPSQPSPLITGLTPPPPAWVPPSNDPFNLGTDVDTPADDSQTLADIEASVHSDHLDAARDEVSKALNDSEPAAPEPIQALNAQPMTGQLHTSDDQPPAGSVPTPPTQPATDYAFDPVKFGVMNDPELPTTTVPPPDAADPLAAPSAPGPAPVPPQVIDPNAPPPVPPPIPFQFGTPGGPPQA